MILLAFKASELSQVSISPPAKRGSLDLDKGATLPSSLCLSSFASFLVSSCQLVLVTVGTIGPKPYRQLHGQWRTPGPEHMPGRMSE